MTMTTLCRAVAACLILASPVAAQSFDPDAQPVIDSDLQPTDVVFWDVAGAEVNAKQQVVALFRLRTEQGFTIYKDKLTLTPPTGYTIERTQRPPTTTIIDPIENKEVEVYTGGEFQVTMSGPPKAQGDTFSVAAKYIGCTTVICLFPYTETMDFEVLSVAEAAPAISESSGMVEEASFEEEWAAKLAKGGMSFGFLILALFVGGLASNLTPCVYPMIPITLRVLSSQGKSPYLSASFYALGIVVTYTGLGVAAAASGGMFGAMMASKTFNIIFAIVMITLGVTMLGFGNFSKLQMLGSRMGTGKPSLRNTFLMGAGAGLVASPCTGPILAALLAYTAKHHTVAESSSLLLVYSIGFALPYILLGGAAAKASQVRVPPQIQIAVKLFFAAVMFGLGFYYLRIPFYSFMDDMKMLWPTIATICLIVGFIGAVTWTVTPRLQNQKLSMILPTTILGMGIFSASQWITATPSGPVSLKWYKTEEKAFAAATKADKGVLVDMWADWCEACKKMDATTFTDKRVIKVLNQDWVLLKLDLTESTDANDLIQEKYELQSLPTLVLTPPDGSLDGKRNIKGYVSANALLKNLRSFKTE